MGLVSVGKLFFSRSLLQKDGCVQFLLSQLPDGMSIVTVFNGKEKKEGNTKKWGWEEGVHGSAEKTNACRGLTASISPVPEPVSKVLC